MRLCLYFDLDKPELSVDYRRIFISFLKNSLTKCNQGFFFDNYFSTDKRKDYTFSVLFKNPKFEKTKITLENNQIKVFFSCDDKNKTGFIFMSAFIEQKHKVFNLPNGNSMVLRKIEPRNEKKVTGSKVIFKTVPGSALACRQHTKETNKDKYFTFDDKEFVEQMQEVLCLQAKSAGFPSDGIMVRPLEGKKVVVKFYSVLIDASVGIFEVEGSTDFLNYLYLTGAGSRTASGFGNVDIVMNL